MTHIVVQIAFAQVLLFLAFRHYAAEIVRYLRLAAKRAVKHVLIFKRVHVGKLYRVDIFTANCAQTHSVGVAVEFVLRVRFVNMGSQLVVLGNFRAVVHVALFAVVCFLIHKVAYVENAVGDVGTALIFGVVAAVCVAQLFQHSQRGGVHYRAGVGYSAVTRADGVVHRAVEGRFHSVKFIVVKAFDMLHRVDGVRHIRLVGSVIAVNYVVVYLLQSVHRVRQQLQTHRRAGYQREYARGLVLTV